MRTITIRKAAKRAGIGIETVRFYERHGFKVVPPQQKELMLRKYWNVPDRQIETSVVLADPAWFAT